jgi:hypothetical protein
MQQIWLHFFSSLSFITLLYTDYPVHDKQAEFSAKVFESPQTFPEHS